MSGLWYNKLFFMKSKEEQEAWLTERSTALGPSEIRAHLWACWVKPGLYGSPSDRKDWLKGGYKIRDPSSGHDSLGLSYTAPAVGPATDEERRIASDQASLAAALNLLHGEQLRNGVSNPPAKPTAIVTDELPFWHSAFAITHLLSAFAAFTAALFDPRNVNQTIVWLLAILHWSGKGSNNLLKADNVGNVLSATVLTRENRTAVINVWPDLSVNNAILIPCGGTNPPRRHRRAPSFTDRSAKTVTQGNYCSFLASALGMNRVVWLINTITALVWYGALGQRFGRLEVLLGHCVPPGNCAEACFWLVLANELMNIVMGIVSRPKSWRKGQFYVISLHSWNARDKLAQFLSEESTATLDDFIREAKTDNCFLECCTMCRLVLTVIMDVFGQVLQDLPFFHIDAATGEWVRIPTFDLVALQRWLDLMAERYGPVPANWREIYQATKDKQDEIREQKIEWSKAAAEKARERQAAVTGVASGMNVTQG